MVKQQALRIIAIVILMLSAPLKASAIEVIASVNQNPVIAEEAFVLTVTINDDVPQTEWQPEPKLGDFEVLNTRSSLRTQSVNGNVSRTTTFHITLLAPSVTGEAAIPAITIRGVSSNPIAMQVIAAENKSEANEPETAFLETTIEASDVFVQQQFKLTARLYLAANLNSGNLIAPHLADAEVNQLGQDTEAVEIINGRRFQVYQRTYLITPQRSGDFKIIGPTFEGLITQDQQNTLFSSFANTQTVSVSAAPLALTVKPIPNDWHSDWLPAELVTLTVAQEPEQATQGVQQGQPLTLTFRLSAIGVSAEQLPDITLPPLPGAMTYPEPPQLDTRLRNGNVIAQKTQTIAIIPRQTDELIIPAQTIAWFNTKTQRTERAATEALVFPVKAASGLQPDYTPTPRSQEAAESTPAQPELAFTAQATPWFWLAIVFAALWLATLSLWSLVWWRQQNRLAQQSEGFNRPSWRGMLWQRLQRACHENNAAAAEAAIKTWAQAHIAEDIGNLKTLGDRLNHQPLISQLEHLSKARYGNYQIEWLEGKALLRTLKAAYTRYRKRQAKGEAKTLPSLYPH